MTIVNNFLVRVSCATYNHAPYIEDAMNGFCMQETTFPFVCTILDDASTDGEPEVIKKYLQEHFELEDKSIVRNEETDDYILTFARHKTNKNCYFAVLYLKYNHYSIKKPKLPYIKEWQDQVKYIAPCEGDDYWIVPKKLQMQVDIMERDSDIKMVYSSFRTVNEHGKSMHRPCYDNYKKISKNGELLSELFHHNFIMTLTVCYRRSIINELYKKCPYTYDYSLFLSAAMQGSFVYIPEETGCYRNAPMSLMNSKKTMVNRGLQTIFYYYAQEFLLEPPLFLKEDEIVKCKRIIAKRLSSWVLLKNSPVNLLVNRNLFFYLLKEIIKKALIKCHLRCVIQR